MAPAASPAPDVQVFYTNAHPPAPDHPDQFHVRYVSGSAVIGMVIQATSKTAGDAGVRTMVTAASAKYPPS